MVGAVRLKDLSFLLLQRFLGEHGLVQASQCRYRSFGQVTGETFFRVIIVAECVAV